VIKVSKKEPKGRGLLEHLPRDAEETE